jgi:polyphosphate glucokinase
MTHAIGIDIGATGTKAAIVDTATGRLVSARQRLGTPRPATPQAVRETVAELVDRLGFAGPAGVALPGVVQHGVARTAANIDPSWIGTPLPDLLDDVLPGPATYLNDADAAGLAEVEYGSAQQRGLVLVVTLGTGIGVALVHDGRLIPNAELGHLELDGAEAEATTSARAREAAGLDWVTWAGRVSRYLQHLEAVFWPDGFVIGGGVSKTPQAWFPLLHARTPLRLATLVNNAGIVGAAIAGVRALPLTEKDLTQQEVTRAGLP